MTESTTKNIRLGLLVLAGLFLLVATLYIIGKNEHLFGSHFELRTRFANAAGLTSGDNVRFAGVQAGTVGSIRFIDDTTLEAVLVIDDDFKPYLRSNAVTSIGTEGLIGNKVVNIDPGNGPAPPARSGDMLASRPPLNTDIMLRTLSRTNDNIAAISEDLRATVRRINGSSALWNTLGDSGLALDLRSAMRQIREAGANANGLTQQLHDVIAGIDKGEGSIGRLLKDTTLAAHLDETIQKLSAAGDRIRSAGAEAEQAARSANTMIRDTAFQRNFNVSMENIRKGTDAFNQDMEALKHNFLLRGYFRRQEKQAAKSAPATVSH